MHVDATSPTTVSFKVQPMPLCLLTPCDGESFRHGVTLNNLPQKSLPSVLGACNAYKNTPVQSQRDTSSEGLCYEL